MNDLATTPEIPVPPASASPATKTRVCPGCGTVFEVPTAGAAAKRRFCSTACQKALNNRAVSQGGPLVPLAMAWRLSRNSARRKELGGRVFEQFVQLIDSLIDEEREEGRTSEMMLDYAAELLREGDVRDRCRRRDRKRRDRRKRVSA